MRFISTTFIVLIVSTICALAQSSSMKQWVSELAYKKTADGYYAKRLMELKEKAKSASTKKGKDQFIAQMEEVKEKLGQTEDERQELSKMRVELKKMQDNNTFKENDAKIAELTTKIDRLSKLALENFDRNFYSSW